MYVLPAAILRAILKSTVRITKVWLNSKTCKNPAGVQYSGRIFILTDISVLLRMKQSIPQGAGRTNLPAPCHLFVPVGQICIIEKISCQKNRQHSGGHA